MRQRISMIFLGGVLCLASGWMAAYGGELNQYEHLPVDAQLKISKYRALRYVLPDALYESAMQQAMNSAGGINIGNVLPGARPPRELNIFIDGDVIHYCVDCDE